jgi:lipoprotein-anchoring transpeptidase ErfK/SrfK
MKRFILILFGIFALALIPGITAQAAETPNGSGAVLCLPGNYSLAATDCLLNGPAAYQAEMAKTGISLPLPPIPAIRPDFNLTYVDYLYGNVHTNNAPVYGSIEDAIQNNKNKAIRRVNGSFVYVSYRDSQVVDGKRVYMVAPGEWMTANDVARVTAPVFQGIEFTETPQITVGWVLTYLSPNGFVETKRTPGYDIEDYTGHILQNHDLVWVYGTAEANGVEWYQLGPNEWVPDKVIARVIPNTTPPDGVTNGRWIEVNLYEQTISVYDNSELIFATLVASGLEPLWTRPGLFQIYQKLDTSPMRGSFEADGSDAYYLEDVPWTMYFDEARAIHGAYWRANLGFPQSHGCVNMSIGDARWLFDWANEGDFVYVWDPSGKTPIDPDAYGSGGA